MGNRINHTNKLREYLGTSTLPEAEARKLYWNNYKAQWRKNRRRKLKEFAISYTQKELQNITNAAKGHKRSTTSFIKEASLAYCTQQFLVPDPQTINQIKELLSLTYTRIQHLTEDEKLSTDIGDKLLDLITQLEVTVLDLLTKPSKK